MFVQLIEKIAIDAYDTKRYTYTEYSSENGRRIAYSDETRPYFYRLTNPGDYERRMIEQRPVRRQLYEPAEV